LEERNLHKLMKKKFAATPKALSAMERRSLSSGRRYSKNESGGRRRYDVYMDAGH
jgi:hypothetical protein